MAVTERQSVAELELLTLYDRHRQLAGWDYGAGQRYAELCRRRYKLELAGVEWLHPEPALTDELAAAFERVGRPRMERARLYGDPDRADGGRTTRSSRATLRTWREIERMVTR